MDTDDDRVAPVCVFSFAFPRIGNVSFRLRFERELGVRVLLVLVMVTGHRGGRWS
jgi:hypothetical protein